MAATANSTRDAYPSVPSYSNDLEFITAYLVAHMLSDASRVYSYILWIALGVVLIACSVLHHLHVRGGHIGALWSKWALRRRTWRKKHSLAVAKARGQPHKQPYSLPSNAQICTFIIIAIASLVLAFLGPDYIAPGASLWTLSDYPTANTASIEKRAYDINNYTKYQPQYTIQKTWWSSGSRTGLIAFALFPLCVLFALKAPPFAIFSIPFLVQFYCDKLLWLHKWTARLIYLLTLFHVAFWSVELCLEHRNGKIAYTFAWQYEKFLFAWTAFGCMTLLFIFSLKPFRTKHYEAFWFLHILLVPLTIVMAGLHHPPVWWWCWAALGLWLGERMWRLTRWLYTNGILGRRQHAPSSKARKAQQAFNHKPPVFPCPPPSKLGEQYSTAHPSNSTVALTHYPPPTPTGQLAGVGLSVPTDYVPPPGYAHAELLPGNTVRLRIVTPGYMTWAPGQHFLVSIPAITRFTTHPFTTASICDEQNAYDDGRVLVFLIRAKSGWTRDLWDTVAMMIGRSQKFFRAEAPPPCDMPARGVLLRALVDGPYGSSIRASWNSYSTVLIMAGGSGVSYALSVLQYVCLCMAGRDGRFLGGQRGGYGQPGFKITRVRFVWLVREFGHIQWCASVLRRCLEIVPGPELQIDIFVTNVKPTTELPPPRHSRILSDPRLKDGSLSPPQPGFAQDSRRRSRDSFSEDGEDNDLDLSYYTGIIHEEGELGHEEHILDYTNFEGDNDTALPGEEQFNVTVKNEGRLRRAVTRRASKALHAKEELSYRAARLEHDTPASNRSTVALVGKRGALPTIDTVMAQSSSKPTAQPATPQSADIDISTVRPSLDEIAEERPESMQSLGSGTRSSVASSHTPLTASPFTAARTPSSATPLIRPYTPTTPMSALGHGQGHDRTFSAGSHLDARAHTPGPGQVPASPFTPFTPRSASRLSVWTDTDSFAALVPAGAVESVREQLRLDLDEQEVEDVGIVAEHARPGKPRLDRILADEVERAKGALAVACCGPTSLDAMIRKVVAAQIDPARVRRGDMRGSIALFSEEFSY